MIIITLYSLECQLKLDCPQGLNVKSRPTGPSNTCVYIKYKADETCPTLHGCNARQ